jgi:hypothetical protein
VEESPAQDVGFLESTQPAFGRIAETPCRVIESTQTKKSAKIVRPHGQVPTS